MKPDHKAALDRLGHYEYEYLPSGKDLLRTYQKIDIFLFTSDSTEAFGNPPLEAMAAGCAVVTTRVGAIPDYSVDGESALHSEPFDTEKMTHLVQHLIDDVDARQKLVSAAQKTALNRGWKSQALKLQTVLLELLTTPEQRT